VSRALGLLLTQVSSFLFYFQLVLLVDSFSGITLVRLMQWIVKLKPGNCFANCHLERKGTFGWA